MIASRRSPGTLTVFGNSSRPPDRGSRGCNLRLRPAVSMPLFKGTPARKPGSQSHRSTALQGHDGGVARTACAGSRRPSRTAVGAVTYQWTWGSRLA